MRPCTRSYMGSLIVACVILSRATFAQVNQYCELKSCEAKGELIFRYHHTMCIHQTDQPSLKCGANAASNEYSPEEIDDIVDWHNSIRSKVALGHMLATPSDYESQFLAANGFRSTQNNQTLPPASNMRALSWNAELATIARRSAVQCDSDLGECHNTGWSDQVGSITIEGPLDTINGSLALAQYFNGHQFQLRVNFRNDEGRSFEAIEVMKNELQVIWGPARELGCGRVGHSDSDGLEKVTMVCLYDKGGTRLGLAYRNGLPCSQCRSGAMCNPQVGLCSSGISWASGKARYYLFLLILVFGVYLLFRKTQSSDISYPRT